MGEGEVFTFEGANPDDMNQAELLAAFKKLASLYLSECRMHHEAMKRHAETMKRMTRRLSGVEGS